MFQNNFMVDLLRGGQQGNVQPQQFAPMQNAQPQGGNVFNKLAQQNPKMRGAYGMAENMLNEGGDVGQQVMQQLAQKYHAQTGM